jgi:hypothetical protein
MNLAASRGKLNALLGVFKRLDAAQTQSSCLPLQPSHQSRYQHNCTGCRTFDHHYSDSSQPKDHMVARPHGLSPQWVIVSAHLGH